MSTAIKENHLGMKSCFRYIFVFLLSIVVTPNLQAQQPAGEDVILKAMQDELNRSMTELTLPNFDKPFFIMYGVRDQNTYSVVANLGSLAQSAEAHHRFKSTTRILVGDYSFNDESLEDNLFSPPSAIDINLPLDNDYAGIRRALWSSTDKVYRDAARHFAKHKETLKETGKNLSEIPHRSFAKSEAVKLIVTGKSQEFDRKVWEDKARRLSELFIHHPNIQNSGIVIQYSEGHSYLVSSEGTVVKEPFGLITFMAVGRSKDDEGEFNMDQVIHYATVPDRLPSEQQLTEEIKNMIARIEAQSKVAHFEDEYTGPVLLTGTAAAEVFLNVLFFGAENLSASDQIPPLTGMRYNPEMNSMENKTGKPVVHESVTVKLKPKLKSFEGTDLLGSFAIDNEGIVPPNELVLIENGILKNLMNNRTLTKPSQTANGFGDGPGVIELTIAQKNSPEALKQMLIAQAKKEGLDYALIVRDESFGMGLLNVYRVSLTDGKEELLQNATMNEIGLRALKRIMGASEKYRAYNINGVGEFSGSASRGGLTSVISPDAVLIEEIQVNGFSMPVLKEEEYVSSPLK